jgi:hypothetical protein
MAQKDVFDGMGLGCGGRHRLDLLLFASGASSALLRSRASRAPLWRIHGGHNGPPFLDVIARAFRSPAGAYGLTGAIPAV